MFSRFVLRGGRRRKVRREEERDGAFVDIHGAGVLLVVLSIVALNLLDAFFTLLFLSHGGTELNPAVQWVLDSTWQPWPFLLMKTVGIGIACGVVLSLASVFLLRLCRTRGWISPTWSKVTVVGIAFACFATAQMLGGSGFIASFTGGLLFGHLLHPHHDHFLDATEGIGDTFALLTWVLFGSAVVGQAMGNFSWPILLYAVLSLTVVRMIPVFLCLTGLGMSRESRLFAGWFGPRGLASIVFAVIATSAGVPHSGTVNMVVVCTVTLSIVAHGLTANPWSKAFGARESQRG